MIVGIVYTRVSGYEQAKDGTSLPEQLRMGQEKAKELGCDKVIPLSDPAEAGDDIGRPGLSEARRLVQAGGITYFICLDPDRFSRDLLIQLLVTREIEAAGTQPVFIDFRYENTPEGQLFYNMKGSISQFQHADIRRKTMRGALARAKQGRIPRGMGRKVYGHRLDGNGNLEVVESEARVIRQIYKWCISEMGHRAIARELNRQGIPAPRGDHWYENTVKRILQNERMAGRFWYNRYETKRKKHGQPFYHKLRPAEEWVLIEVPPIVDADTWNEAQRAQAVRRPSRPSRFYLLSGLLRCGYCGETMRARTETTRGRQYYVCQSGYRDRIRPPGWKPCKARHHRSHELEKEVWARVERWLENEKLWRHDVATARDEYAPRQNHLGLKSELEELRGERDRLLDALQKGAVTLDLIEGRLSDLNRRIKQLEGSVQAEASERIKRPRDAAAVMEEVRSIVPTGEGRRKLLLVLIDEVIVWDDSIRLVPRIIS